MAATIELMLTPVRTEMWERVSPGRTVTEPELLPRPCAPAEGRAGAGAGAADACDPGIRSTVPGMIHRPPWVRELARARESTLTP